MQPLKEVPFTPAAGQVIPAISQGASTAPKVVPANQSESTIQIESPSTEKENGKCFLIKI
jgi:hypothetical protein